MLGLKVHEQAEHVEQVDQLGGVLGEPGLRLDFLQRGEPPGAHRGALPVPATVAEPLVQHVDPGDVVLAHPRRDVADVAAADAEFVFPGVVAERVGHVLGITGDGVAAEDFRCPVVRQSRRGFQSVIGRVVEVLAVAV